MTAGFALCASILSAAESKTGISAASLLARTKILSSDEYEGRAPATAGEEKTVSYLIAEFKKLGLQPGNPNGTFIQNTSLAGLTAKPVLNFTVGGQSLPMENINDFVGLSTRIAPHVEAKDTDMVFVGYGIVAPEFGWDDYKGVDVRGKTVVMLINDPPVVDPKTGELDPKIFGGKAMTYYGRWTYKYEIAAAKGAAACLIVHETAPAAYPFGVVVTSWSRENFEIRTPDLNAGHVGLSGWLTLDATKRLVSAGGHDFDGNRCLGVPCCAAEETELQSQAKALSTGVGRRSRCRRGTWITSTTLSPASSAWLSDRVLPGFVFHSEKRSAVKGARSPSSLNESTSER